MLRKIMCLLVVAVLLGIGSAQGAIQEGVYDLTTKGSSATINDALFWVPEVEMNSGTGMYDPFLRIQANGEESGINTDGTALDEKTGKWTHLKLLSTVPEIQYGGEDFLQFTVDINENNNYLSLDEFQIFVSISSEDAAKPTDYSEGMLANALVYNLDVPEEFDNSIDNSILLNYENYAGSGKLDMFVQIPKTSFPEVVTDSSGNVTTDYYVYLFSKFSGSDDGFEEWATITPARDPGQLIPDPPIVPEPATLAIWSVLGVAGLALRRFKAA